MLDAHQDIKGMQRGTAHWDEPPRPGTVAPPPGFAGSAKASFKAADTTGSLHTDQQVCALFSTLPMHLALSKPAIANTQCVAGPLLYAEQMRVREAITLSFASARLAPLHTL